MGGRLGRSRLALPNPASRVALCAFLAPIARPRSPQLGSELIDAISAPALMVAQPLMTERAGRQVNERLFGRCNHDFWHQFTNQHDQRVLVCDNCGDEFMYQDRENFLSQPQQTLSPTGFMRQQVREYASGDVLPSLVLRQIENGGWSVLVKSQGTTFSCEIRKEQTVFLAGPTPGRNTAVIQAAAALARSGLFIIPG